jgi:dipeptidyl aminopeptidase/acylaminoacyl peptidase
MQGEQVESAQSIIVSRYMVHLPPYLVKAVAKLYRADLVETTTVEDITYLSDGLKVKGYIAYPKAKGTYPVLIWNRGGYADKGALDDLRAFLILASTAAWGYVVLATQYRGNRGGEGQEDWGDKDINDSLNLIEVAKEIPRADISRIAIEGASRGGMTTYRALTMEDRFRCAIVHAGVSDIFALAEIFPEFGRFVDNRFGDMTVDDRQREMSMRSAVYFADQFPKDCPILLLHGDKDRRVPISQSQALAAELKRLGRPHELVVIEGGGHVALKDGSYKKIDGYRKAWLKKYLG